jgi:hypothetical protein
MNCLRFWFRVLGGCFAVLSQAWALPSQSLESIEYLTYQGVAAIEIGFAEPVHYLSSFPLTSGATLEIFIGPRTVVDSAVDKLPYTQAMRAPDSSEVPLTQVTFRINEAGESSVVVDFERVVNFSVLAGRTANTLIIALPELKVTQTIQIKNTRAKSVTNSKSFKQLVLGRKALKQGNNALAIRIFTTMLGLPATSPERQEALELLGVARERNGQIAHAKAMYREYLKQYPKSEEASRVKQRLQDLLYAQLKPKAPLKTKKKQDSKTTSRVYGSFAQYYYRGESNIDGVGSLVDNSLLLNQLSLNWRIRSADYDVRNYVFASQSDDFATDSGKALTLETAYSQFKNSRLGFSGRAGRQTGSGGGVLGKFDGLRGSYNVTHKIAVNAVLGYPVNISDKRSIQTQKPFIGIGAEVDGEGKDVDILPYYIRQEVDGIVDREAIGSEFRFFHKLVNFYGLIDYDIAYSDLNMYLFRGQYNWRKNTSFSLNFDYRNNPLLFTSNALIGRTDASTIEELLKIRTEEQINELAEDRVGNSTTLSFGVSHTIDARYQLNGDVIYAQQEYVIDGTTPGFLIRETEQQIYISSQLIINKWFNDRDISILGVRLSQTNNYDELSLSALNRLPLKNKWKFDSRFRVDLREADSGENLARFRPSVRWDFHQNKTMYYEAELGVEWWRYGGDTNNPDVQRLFANLGYRWNF